MSNIQLSQTRDGSWTCFNEEVGEHYHNLSGALTETTEIYVTPAQFEKRLQKTDSLCIFDPFFGLGYNTVACMQAFQQLQQSGFSGKTLEVVAIEKDPNILEFLPQVWEKYESNILKQILHALEHNIYYQTQQDFSGLDQSRKIEVSPGIFLHLIVGDIRRCVDSLPSEYFDLIYQDPFSPRKQPELWTKQLFQRYFRLLKPDTGTMMTYSAAAGVRTGLSEAGFFVYPLIIPQHKSGTLASMVPRPDLAPFDELEQALINCRSGFPFEDNETLSRAPDAILKAFSERQAQSTGLLTSSEVHRRYGHHKQFRV
jgi:tRNA U34 5-methylaminomethyl-2-thiouridine-forming methyltransferase MnmC